MAAATQQGSSTPTNPDGSTIPTSSAGLNPMSGGQIAGFQPWGYAPDTYNATMIDQSQMPGALSSFENEVMAGLAPTFQAQQVGLDDNLASRGIVNTGAATYENQQLAGQQAGAVAQGEIPLISDFAGFYNQNNQLNAEFANSANAFNAGAGNQANQFNTGAQDTFLSSLLGYGNAQDTALRDAFLGSYGPNQGAIGTPAAGAAAAGQAYENGYYNSGTSPYGAALGAVNWGGLFNVNQANTYGANTYGTYPDGTAAG